MKKGSKLNYELEPQYKLKRNGDNKSPSVRPEIAFKPQKVVEHKSLEYKNSNGFERNGGEEDRTNPLQSKPSVRRQYGREDKNAQASRSRSKDKKDHLTLNLAKFTRKNKATNNKEEKTPESIYIEKMTPPEDNHSPSQNPHSEHTEEHHNLAWESNQFKHNYLEPASHSNNRQSMFSEEFESVISQETIERHDEKPVTPHSRKVQTVQYKKMDHSQAVGQVTTKPPAKMETSSHSLYANYQNYPAPKSPQLSSKPMDISKKLSSLASERQQNRVIEDLSAKMQRQREQFNATISKLQGEKAELQRTNKQLIENQFTMKNQIELLKVKNIQLVKDQDNVKLMANESGQEREKTVHGLEQALKETEGQLARAISDLRVKSSENNHLMMKMHELEGQCHDYNNELSTLQHKNVLLAGELQKEMKTSQSQKQQIRNLYEFKLKEASLKQGGSSVQQQRLKAILADKLKQVASLKKEIGVRDERIQQLTLTADEGVRERLSNQLKTKELEVDSLIEELNYNQEKMISLTNQLSESTKYYESELKKKAKVIRDLEQRVMEYQRESKKEGLDRRALEEMYHLTQEGERESGAFLEIQQKQSQEMNILRDQISSKNQLLQNSQLENQELKDRIRKLEQETQMNQRTINANIANLKQAKEAGETVMKAEVESLKRKMGSLEMRLGLKDQEIREKNRFIQQHLMSSLNGREDAKVLIGRLQEIMGMKN